MAKLQTHTREYRGRPWAILGRGETMAELKQSREWLASDRAMKLEDWV